MGGGPRTYPGGVSKWQWKKMQAKKAKQLLKARLARERQIYEMRKRAELQAAVSELERPWEVVEKAPTLFSASADEQVKVLADRFQRPGGFDLWSEKDGPQLFETKDGFPSARFFPKGVVHSIKPYGRIADNLDGAESADELSNSVSEDVSGETMGVRRHRYRRIGHDSDGVHELSDSDLGLVSSGNGGKMRVQKYGNIKNPRKLNGLAREEDSKERVNERGDGRGSKDKFRKKGNRIAFGSANSGGSNRWDSGRASFDQEENGKVSSGRQYSKGSGFRKAKGSNSEVFDMSLQQDGSYGFPRGL